MWLAAAAWFALCVAMSRSYFRAALDPDVGFIDRPERALTGLGSLTLAALPLVGAGLIHRYYRRRRRGRLLKEKERIERQLRRIDEREGRRAPAAAPAAPAPSSVAPASES